MIKFFITLAFILSIALLTACEETTKGNIAMAQQDTISSEDWEILSQRHIVFGHQSVGRNILSGVQELSKQAGVNLRITESQNASIPGISHFTIGQNEHPYSKTNDFRKTFESGTVKGADIAMMKLCYIDFNRGTDAIKLANDYIESLDLLSKEYPDTQFIIVTTPLTTVQGGPKALVKQLLGKAPDGYLENYKRKQFNDFLRYHYSKEGRLFDLAKYENSGARTYTYKEHKIEVLNPAITDDGGHLNAKGQQYIAAKLLKFLATIPLVKTN